MKHLAFLYLACILAGWALIHLAASGFLTAPLLLFFHIIGALAVLVFSLVLIYLGVRALFSK